MSQIDLSVGGYEQATGGDLALILDVEDGFINSCDLEPGIVQLTGMPRGHVIIPIVFQAKRYIGLSANISQHHETRGYQYDTLLQSTCASNYIFFENGPDKVKYPALPMIKATSACLPPSTSPQTEVSEKTVDLATYVLQAIDGSANLPVANSPEEALNMILANASPDRLSRVSILGNKPGLELEYSRALIALRSRITDDPSYEHSSHDPRR